MTKCIVNSWQWVEENLYTSLKYISLHLGLLWLGLMEIGVEKHLEVHILDLVCKTLEPHGTVLKPEYCNENSAHNLSSALMGSSNRLKVDSTSILQRSLN